MGAVRTSKTTMNRSGNSVHLCLVPYLKGNTVSFSSLSMMLAMMDHAFIILRRLPLCLPPGEFLSQMDVKFYLKSFLQLLRSYSFYSSLVNMVITLVDLKMVKKSFHHQNKCQLIIRIILLMYCCIPLPHC